MTKVERFAFGILAIITVLAFIFWKDVTGINNKAGLAAVKAVKSDGKENNKKDKKETNKATDPKITITKKWELPSSLKEISGIAYMEDNRFACIQDEEGKIFVFNTETSKIENEIQFGDAGDYEGIAIVNKSAYVLRADGQLFEVDNFAAQKPSLVQHKTHLTAKQNVEGLCYDKKNNRLLLAIKGKEFNTSDYKGIYAFDLSTKKLGVTPVLKIDLTHNIWKDVKGKNKIQPSDLEMHPHTGDIYIVDGPDPKLLVMGADGAKKEIYQLSDSDFPQPEGISFTEAGELFISNEGKNGLGNILKILIGKE